MREVGDVDLGGEGPATREDAYQVLEREAFDRLADRSATHLELAAELVLVDRLARLDLKRDQPIAQLLVCAVGEQRGRAVLSLPER